MRIREFVLSGLAAGLLVAAAPLAASASEEVDGDAVEETEAEAPLINDTVTVTGRTFRQSFEFTRELTDVPRRSGLLARWDLSICPAVSGIPADKAQMIADRISERALEVGLRPGEPGCKPDIAIVVAMDGDEAAKAMYDSEPKAFSLAEDPTVRTPGKFAFEKFLKTTHPVRWWHVSETRSEQGHDMASGGQFYGRGAAANLPTVSTTSSSRLKGSYRQDLHHVVIIVDAQRVQGVRLDALADYLAFISLAQVDPDAETDAFDTILNLFDADGAGDTTLTGMTEADTAYLKGLYDAKRNAKTARQQEREIANSMQQ